MLPQLREIEHRFPHEVVVVGVHSGKYITERDPARIREASLRMDVHHPIVNDRQFRVWRSYAVRAWPTIVVIDPTGHVVGQHAGELTAEQLAPFLEKVIAVSEDAGTLRRETFDVALDPPAIAPGMLRYPGKVDVLGDRMAIADTGHHRILLGRLSDGGRRLHVERTLGDGEPGLVDGASPRFRAPQGVRFDGDGDDAVLWVADAGNHAVRRVRLADGHVSTVAGTGGQLRTRADLDAGALSSPWDIVRAGDELFVAMAGNHRLYAIDVATGRARVHAGSGAEELHDASLADSALAQPMGIAASGDTLWFVDAESSAVRRADVSAGGRVATVVGTGLFDFGDVDGAGDAVRMQHQQAIAVAPDGRLLVADSYNDALKWVDPATREARTWLRGFHEPSGLAFGDGVVFVADTNAHRVAVASLESGTVETLGIVPGR